MEELSEEDKQTVARARRIQRFLTQPFFVAEQFTGNAGQYVSLKGPSLTSTKSSRASMMISRNMTFTCSVRSKRAVPEKKHLFEPVKK